MNTNEPGMLYYANQTYHQLKSILKLLFAGYVQTVLKNPYKQFIFFGFVLTFLISFSIVGAQNPVDYGGNPGLVFWLKGDQGVTGTSPVAAWADQSGNNNNATQVNTGPDQIISASMNNQSVMSFGGANNMTIANDSRINQNGGSYQGDYRSMFIAFRTGADVNNVQYIYEEGGGTNGIGVFVKNGNIYVTVYNDGNTNNRMTAFNGIAANTSYTFSFLWNLGTLTARLNNAAFSSQSSNGTITSLKGHTGAISIGYTDGNTRDENGNTENGPAYFTGEIAEMLYYDETLSTADEIAENDILAQRYGIGVTNLTYYSYQSGNWGDIGTWTMDPGGTLQTATKIPGKADRVIILTGRTVTLTSDVDTTNLDVTINEGGFLNLGAYQFTNGLTALRGQGTLKLSSAQFPIVATNSFVATGGGTTEYNNTSDFTLAASQNIYNNLTINTPGITATQLSDLTLNGDLHVQQGTFRINNNASNTALSLTINGNVTVDNGATLGVGHGSANTTTIPLNINGGTAPFLNYYRQFHTVIMKGDFTNNGTVRFTNLNYPVYNAFPPTGNGATSGAATVYFMGASDNKVTCNGTTDFYNLVLDKGLDQTFRLTVYANAYEHFRLFGANNSGGYNNGPNPELRKALWIRSGTMVLKGLTIIPSLTEGSNDGTTPNSDYYVPVNGALVLDGTDVVVLSTADDYREVNVAYGISGGSNTAYGISPDGSNPQSFSIYGRLQINNGYFSTRESGGFVTWDQASGQFIINGGTVDAKQFRAAGGASGLASYEQNGGTFILRGRFRRTPTQYTSVSDLVNVSTATLNTNRNTNGLDGTKGTFNINNAANVFIMSGGTMRILDVCGNNGYAYDVFSSDNNINVTGGTVEFSPYTGSGGDYNFLVRSNASFGNVLINRASSTSQIQLGTYPLNIIGNLTLSSGVLIANDLDVSIGGNYTVANGTTYTPGNNWTIFNGNGSQSFTVNTAAAFSLKKFKVEKPTGTTLTLTGSQSTITVSDSVMLLKGTLNDGGKTINFTTSGTTTTSYLYNSGVHTGTGKIMLADNDPQVISGDGNGIFQNLELNNTDALAAPVSLAADITINGSLTFSQDKLLNIDTYNLKLNSGATIINGGPNRYIETSGNAGDGGLTMEYSSIAAITFPVGAPSTRHAAANYTPATIGFSTTPTTLGSITVIPVGYEHPNTTNKGRSLTYFWRVKSTGFILGSATVTQQYTYSQQDVVAGGNVSEAGYVGAYYNNSTYAWIKGNTGDVDQNNNTIGGSGTFLANVAFIDGEYTAGDDSPTNPFGTPTIYYSRQSGLWSNVNTWSLTGHTVNNPPAVPPGASDIIIIGGNDSVYLATNLTVANTGVQNCASLQIEKGSALDIGYNPGCNFGIVRSHPNGNGNLRVTTDYDSPSTFEFPGGDYSDFNINLGTTELYTTNYTAGTTYWLPNDISSYGNLIISPVGGSNIIFGNTSLTIYGDLVTRGQNSESWFCPTWDSNYPTAPYGRTAKSINIKGDFHLQGGAFIYYGNYNLAQEIKIDGDFIIDEYAGIRVYSRAYDQTIQIGGNLVNNSRQGGGVNAYAGCDFTDIPVTFFGSQDAEVTNTSGNPQTTFGRVTVNKGNSQSTVLNVNIEGTLNTPNDNWLTLQNGTLKYIRTGNLHITTGSSFTIPGTAGLYINTPSTVYIANNNSNNNDVYLGGKLTLIDGNVYIGPTNYPNYNNDIEYTGSGLSEIEIQGGNLNVNGQIRRNPATTAGVLKYTQSSGSVTIHGNNSISSNAKLEILNSGSEFNMSGGTLTIVRGGGGNTYGDLYLRPESSSVSGGDIYFSQQGLSGNAENYILDATVPLNNLTVDATGGNNATVKLLISPLALKGNLMISNGNSIFDANTDYNIDVSIQGDYTNNGTYNHYNNLTVFNGGTQSITGTSDIDFYKLEINPVTKVTLQKPVTVMDDLQIDRGTLECGTSLVDVKGDVTNNGTYTDSGSGIRLSGLVTQHLAGTGTFGRLETDNSQGARMDNAITLQKDLVLTSGVFDINRYLLTLSANSNIQGAPFSVSKMITSDGEYSNVGIRKIFNSYSGSLQTFTFPLGTTGKYTPAVLSYSNIGQTGSLRINNINSAHPGVFDPTNVLKYFWEMESSGISGFDGSLVLNYKENDVQGTQESQYIAARLIIPGTSWSKAATGSATDNVDENNNTITFNFSGTNNLSGEYTAGIDPALPVNVPEYTSVADGDWTDQTKWVQTGGDTYPCPVGGPNGFMVVIDHTITADENYCSAYRTTINGELRVISPYFGHNLGTISGNGTLYLESGTMPAGRYTSFLDCATGGTLAYGGSTNYNIIADLYNSVPNLLFTGTGTRVLPNKNLTICDRLVIDGPTLDNSINNRKLAIQGTMERYNSGKFISGTGTGATVTFEGSSNQVVGGVLGDFAGANAFNNLEINNASGLRINNNGAIEVTGNLLLTSGKIKTTSSNTLTISNAAINCVYPEGGSNSSYVNGPLIKKINQGDHFLFPVGDEDRAGNKLTLSATQSGTVYWTVQYFSPNSTHTTKDPNLSYVNAESYWRVSAPAGNMAVISLDWDPLSDLTPLMTANGLSDMRVSQNNSGSWDELPSTASGNNYNGTVSTISRITLTSGSGDFTLACINSVKPRAKLSPAGPVCGTSGIPVTFTASVPIPFNYVLNYTIDGTPQSPVTVTSTPYTLPTPVAGTYQLTNFQYNSGSGNGVVDINTVETFDVPSTANAGPDQSVCGGTSVTLAGNSPVTGTGLWSIVSGSGGTVVDPTINNSTFNGTNGSGYTLRWTISNGACASSDDVAVSFPLLPMQPEAFTMSSDKVCQGETGVQYIVPIDNTVTYNWSYTTGTGAAITGTTNSVQIDYADNASSGTVEVTATNGCGTSDARTINVTVNAKPDLTLTIDLSMDKICDGDFSTMKINFTAGTGPYTFSISDGTNTDNLTNISGTSYDYTSHNLPWIDDGTYDTDYDFLIPIITDANGCSNTNLGNKTVTVFKQPVTGPTYHISNDF